MKMKLFKCDLLMKPQTKKPSENTAVKILERKSVIRLFGLGLFLAPIINATIVIWLKKIQVVHPITLSVLSRLFASGTFTQKFLTLASVVIGIIMLFGSTKAWKFVLGLLGCHILIQIFNLGHDLRENWLWGPFFVVNISIFFFIADQLVFKLKIPTVPAAEKPKPPANVVLPAVPIVAKPAPVAASASVLTHAPVSAPALAAVEPREYLVKSKILIHFDQHGPWGQLTFVSTAGLRVRCLSPVSINMDKRDLELTFKNGLHVKSRLRFRQGQDFFFEFIPTTASNQKLLEEWIQRQSA